jgi:F-type H+-transporting ATPase subunit b
MYFVEMIEEVFDPTGPEFFILLATLIILGFAWRAGAFTGIGKALDARGEAIRKELEQARALREEAQKLLADYQRKQKEAQAEADAIITAAKAEAERFKVEQIAKVQDFVVRRTKLAEQKIAQAEVSAVAEVRAAAADAAIAAATSILAHQVSNGSADVMTPALREIRAKLN